MNKWRMVRAIRSVEQITKPFIRLQTQSVIGIGVPHWEALLSITTTLIISVTGGPAITTTVMVVHGSLGRAPPTRRLLLFVRVFEEVWLPVDDLPILNLLLEEFEVQCLDLEVIYRASCCRLEKSVEAKRNGSENLGEKIPASTQCPR